MLSPPTACWFFVAAALLVGEGGAQGTEPLRFLHLQITNPDGAAPCVSEAALRSAIAARLGAVAATAQNIAVNVSVIRKPPAWQVDLDTTIAVSSGSEGATQGRRSLTLGAEACVDLLPPLAFIITMMIDRTAELAHEPPPLPPASPWRSWLSVTGGPRFGDMPAASAMGVARWQWGPRESTNLALTLAYARNESTLRADARLPRAANATFWDARLGVQIAQPVLPYLWGTLGLDCGVTNARGSKADVSAVDRSFGCATTLGAAVTWPLSPRWALAFLGNAAVPWQRSRYIFTDATGSPVEVFRSMWLRFDATVGVAARF